MELEIGFKDSSNYRMHKITKGMLDELRKLIVTKEGQQEFREWKERRCTKKQRETQR